jgi:hypothetical protein
MRTGTLDSFPALRNNGIQRSAVLSDFFGIFISGVGPVQHGLHRKRGYSLTKRFHRVSAQVLLAGENCVQPIVVRSSQVFAGYVHILKAGLVVFRFEMG